jgi:hypothetical protein
MVSLYSYVIHSERYTNTLAYSLEVLFNKKIDRKKVKKSTHLLELFLSTGMDINARHSQPRVLA